MSLSSINGLGVPLASAIAEAAELIGKSRLTVVAGLGADVAGARAAVALCERIGGAIDHMHSAALLRDLDVMREYGAMLTTPGEARIRGDVVLLVGNGLLEAGLLDIWPDPWARKLEPPAATSAARKIIWLGENEAERRVLTQPGDGAELDLILAGAPLPELLAGVRARVNGRPVTLPDARLGEIDAIAEALRRATFGVAVWSAASIDALSLEMLSGLVRDLNAETRFTGLPLPPRDNGSGVNQVCGWLTGLPVRTGFARGFAEHDPWVFDAERLIESGEADCVVWISAYGAEVPRFPDHATLIALADAAAEFTRSPAVRVEIGRPGVDHDGVDYCASMATFASRTASRPSEAPSAAATIGMLLAALDDRVGAASC
jgi:formylmethanofuran dehydrogenase subunit B